MTATAIATAVPTIKRRRAELGLLVLALALTVSAYVLVSLGRTAKIPTNLRPFLGVIAGLLAVAHIATRRFAKHADAGILPIAGLLNGLGYVMIVRLNPTLANRQAAWTAVGIGAYVLTLVVVRKARQLERFRYTFAFVGMGLLLLPLVPGLGYNINGSRIWAHFGPISFQPGELAKLSLAVFFASYLIEKRELLGVAGRRIAGITFPEFRHAGPLLIAWMVSILVMVAESDLGSSLLFFAFFIAMLWVATQRNSYLLVGGVLFVCGSLASWQLFAHVHNRVRIWIDPWPTATKGGYQIVQSLYAFGSGGRTGTGLALGSPTRIPYAATDFIFAAIGEELGLFGTCAVLALFLVLVGTGLRTALRASTLDRPFDALLAVGLTTILALQTFIIVGGVTRIVPLTGVTLPFVSYGGSSLVVNYMLIALLVRISHDTTTAPDPAASNPRPSD